ncbi:MAG: tRNA pseudouridine(38-40) synthase TruA [Ignavibacteriae bacterium]|nr:tRNA pseudouridine(38-40) synthase TruA [Ignavibacteriota bacterium]MCB9206983.1 tRNA pseudouridine(38-40) synthase TruA [Ignavibacteriales bacterium]MCB9210492.1 tRNA pseudouridine(38-40) synthase TruA [Ignavibacteriales bacterium]
MPNYKITIQYDGTDFYGWQSQPNGNTIQDKITEAIFKITNQKIDLKGSGRTDAGVHSLGQVANFLIADGLNLYRFQHSLNAVLPNSIAVKNIAEVEENYNARFDAKKRSYLYFLSKNKSPFYQKYSYYYPYLKSDDLSFIKKISKSFFGEHDFTSFCKTQTDTENKNCNIFDISFKTQGDFIIFKIEANRFLHGMVRTIIGTLLKSVKNKNNSNIIDEIINAKNRESAGEALPAKGLFLYKVKY